MGLDPANDWDAGASFGVYPVHFGVIVVVNRALGMFAPLLGVNLFTAAQVANIPVQKMI